MVLNVNGVKREVNVDPDVALLTVLRDHLDLTGSKYGCGEGACGACTVLINDNPTRSCITPVGNAANKEITTIEGLARNSQLNRVQEAFCTEGGMQCGYCTPGMIMSVKALLNRSENPTESEIRDAISNNLCRCTGYTKIVKAVQRAATFEEFTGAPIVPEPVEVG